MHNTVYFVLTSRKTFFFKFYRKQFPNSVTGMTQLTVLTVNIKTTGRSYHHDIFKN